LPPQGSDNGRLGNPPCDQPTHFTPQVLQGRLSDGKTTALNSPEPNGVADDLSREAVAGIARTGRCRHPARLPGSAASRKPAGSQVDGATADAMLAAWFKRT